VENTVITLARRGEEKTALTFLRPRLPAWPNDWRLSFLAALLEWRTDEVQEAAGRLVSLASVSAPLRRAGGSATAPSSPPGYEESLIRIMPPDTQQFLRLVLEVQTSGVSNRRQVNYNELPSDPVELQNRSAAMLLSIARFSSPERGAELIAGIERLGFSFARLIPELPHMRRLTLDDRSEDFSRLLREYPGSRPLLALAALNAAYPAWNEPADAAMAERAWAAFRESAPEAALILALPGAGQKGEPAGWEQEVLAAVEKHASPSPLLCRALARCLGRSLSDDNRDRRSALPPAWRRRLFAQLQRWQRALEEGGAVQGFTEDLHDTVFRGMAGEFSETTDAAALAALLDEEWRWQESRPQSTARQYSPGDDPLAQPLGFPPVMMPGLPATLRGFIQRELKPETAGLTAPLVQRPELKFLLLSKSPAGASRAALEEMLKVQTGTAAPFVLAAAWEEKSGNFAAAAEMAAKALFLPVSQDVRRTLDGALAFWSARKGKPGGALYAAGREAVLRLWRDAITNEQRTELAKLMDALGLTEEADRFVRQGKARESQVAGTALERARRLLEEGRPKEAMPVLLLELRNRARQRVAGGSLNSGKDLAVWRTLVQVHGLLAKVMEEMLPANATPLQMAEYAAACELTGDLKNAREFYERALAGGQKKNLREILVPLLVREDAGKAVALLREIPGAWKGDGFLLWTRPFMPRLDRIDTLEGVIEFGSLVERMVDVMPEDAARDFPLDSIIGVMDGDCRAGELHTVSALSEGNEVRSYWELPVPAAEAARIEAMARERIAVMERICRKLMHQPGSGLTAWGWLRYLREYGRNQNPAELAGEGMAIIVRELKPGPQGRRPDENGEDVKGTLNLLMRDAAKSGRIADFAREVVPAVKAAFSPAAAGRLLEEWPLYESDAGGFAEAARTLLKSRGAKAWGEVIEAAVLRGTGADLTPDLLRLCSGTETKDLEPVAWQFPLWCQLLEKSQNRTAAETFIRAALDTLLGPASERAGLLKDESATSKPGLLHRILCSLMDEEQWLAFAMRYLRDEVLPYVNDESSARFSMRQDYDSPPGRHLTAMLEKGNLKGARAWLDSLPVTEDLPGFYGGGYLMNSVFQTLGRQSAAKLEALGLGGDPSKLTFGRQVLLAARGQYAGVCNALAGWQSRLDALPEPHRRRVLSDLREILGTLPEDAPAAARRFHEWLQKGTIAREKAETEASLEKFLKNADAGTFADAEALNDTLRPLFYHMASDQHPRGRELVRRGCRLMMAFGDHESQDRTVENVVNLMRVGQNPLSPRQVAWAAGILAEALRAPGAAGEFYKTWRGGAGRILLGEPDRRIGDRLEDFVKLLGPVLQPGDARLVVLWLLYDDSVSKRDYAGGLRWVEENGNRFPWPELIHEIKTALRLLNSSDETKKSGGGLSGEEKHYLEILRDASLPLRLRVTMAVSLTNIADGSVELKLELARLLRRALEERVPVSADEEAEAFEMLMKVPSAARNADLVKALVSHTSLSRLRTKDEIRWGMTRGLSGLMDLALTCGDLSTVDRLLGMDNGYPNFSAVAVLARHGEGKRLAALISRNPGVLGRTEYVFGPLARFDATLQSQLPRVLDGIADPGLRFETFALLNALRDVDPAPPETKIHAKRTEEISAGFAKREWKSPEAKDRMLSGFVDLGGLDMLGPGRAVSAAVNDAASRVPAGSLTYLDDPAKERYSQIHGMVALTAAGAGDFKPLRSAVHEILSSSERDSEEVSNFMGNLFHHAKAGVIEGWPDMAEPARASACEGWRAVMADSVIRNEQWREWQEILQFGVLLHGIAGKMAELTAWHAALPGTERLLVTRALERRDGEGILPDTGIRFDSMTGSREERATRRDAAFSALAANTLAAVPLYTLYEDYMAMEDATDAEFLKLETPLTRARPHDGWLVVAFAKARTAAGAWDVVLERTSAALAKEKPSLETAWAPLLELRTLALEKTGHAGETTAEIRALLMLPEPETRNSISLRARAAAGRLIRRPTPQQTTGGGERKPNG
jgi:hypothetical protein